jgi:glycosyltransferase involved in cell wall biosynthesis
VKILHFNQYGSHQGGVEGYIADVTAALQARGHTSHLIALTPNDGGRPIAPTTYAPAPDWPSSIDAVTDVIRGVIAEFKPDVAYVHAVYHPGLVDWLAQSLPTVAYIHAPYPVCPGSAQYLRKSARVCPHTAGAICLIEAQLEKCCWGRHPLKHIRLVERTRRFTQAHRKLRRVLVGSEFMRNLVIRGGTSANSIECLSPVLLDSQQLPDFYAPDNTTVLYAGRLTTEKGIGHLIEALAVVPGRWRLLIAGDGPERGPSQVLARQLGVADRIEYLGWLDQREMSRCFQQCTVVGFPSLWPEPFGRVGPEAYTHGRPVVAYATGGVPAWLTDGETGYLVTPGDTVQLGQRLRQLLEAPALCQQMGERARRIALERWAAERHIRQLISVFETALTHEE